MKNISFKVEESELKRLNYYRNTQEGGKQIISDFVKEAIKEKCERVRQLRAGGFNITVPNPDNFNLSEEEKAKTMQVLTQTIAELSKTNVLVNGYLTEMLAYLQYHFYGMTDIQKKKFEDNFEIDLGIEAELDELENAEFEEVQKRAAESFK